MDALAMNAAGTVPMANTAALKTEVPQLTYGSRFVFILLPFHRVDVLSDYS
jgi:hypothetical protein